MYNTKNPKNLFKIIIYLILGILSVYFLITFIYNTYFNPLLILKKYYDTMFYARIYYLNVLNDNTLSSNTINDSLKAYLNKMIEERKKYVLDPKTSEKLMKEYYIHLDDDAISIDTKSLNIKKVNNGYIVHIINGDLVSYDLDSKGNIIKRVIKKEKLRKIKYPENKEITFYIVRTWKGLKIDWIKSVYNYSKNVD
ncbi:hypothetical protein [Marinitoga sp. 38H-ov]|uniref:hypothetical protein n=1 Tax=Marinitoga sp. 38H-ov TaxID=1755814 RepID=UPI0013ED0CF7|nr:hypothetical protein [Marinitoga sp. 38H-ov]KAF2955243.1 hypothetical protein AS160_01715 [Marinitoga sp. 38H-ov]